MKLYENIKRLRKEKGYTQDDLARLTGYTDRSSIAKIERGSVDLPQSKIKQFADIFGVTQSYLMGWEDEQNKNDALADIVLRLRSDDELFEVVSAVCNLERERLSGLAVFLKQFKD